MEAKLRETKRHATEQAEFFQREIQEANKIEKDEDVLHGAQLRRMRLAILKWRHDYMRDAKIKAREAIDRRKSRFDREAEAAEANTGDGGGDVAATTVVETVGRKAQAIDDIKQVDLRESAPSGPAPSRQESKTEQQLHKCQKVLGEIWKKLPAEEETARSFLERVEGAFQFSEEVLALYEDHLQEHGLLAPLHATELAGRAPEADHADGEDDDVQSIHARSLSKQPSEASAVR